MPHLKESFPVSADALVDGRSWIQVLLTAEKARNGPWFFTITADDLAGYARSIAGGAWRIPIDRDHGGDRSNRDLRDTRAAGWFTGQSQVLEAGAIRPDGSNEPAPGPELWAEVKWTPKALDEIRDGEYRFISPTWSFAQKDNKTGLMTKAKEIIAATLTNRPFFEMAPVKASEEEIASLDYIIACYDEEISEQVRARVDEGESVLEAFDNVLAAVWTGAYINSLPDSAFLYVEPGKKDRDKKTVPRSLRHFPVRDDAGAVDLPHLRNALARIPQSNLPDEVKQSLTRKAKRLLTQSASSAHDQGDDDMELKVIASALGLAEDADEQAVTEAIATAKAEKEQLDAKVKELEAAAASDESARSRSSNSG